MKNIKKFIVEGVKGFKYYSDINLIKYFDKEKCFAVCYTSETNDLDTPEVSLMCESDLKSEKSDFNENEVKEILSINLGESKTINKGVIVVRLK